MQTLHSSWPMWGLSSSTALQQGKQEVIASKLHQPARLPAGTIPNANQTIQVDMLQSQRSYAAYGLVRQSGGLHRHQDILHVRLEAA